MTDYESVSIVDHRESSFVASSPPIKIEVLLKDFDNSKWDIAVGKMKLNIARGNVDSAIEILKNFASHPRVENVTMSSSVHEAWGAKIANMLEEHGLENLLNVDKATDEFMMTIRNLSEGTLKKIRKRIKEVKEYESVQSS